MRNIRIDSLPQNRHLASKDCRLCNKRRIKCDRSFPQCKKCVIRGLHCPGFDGVQLRWSHKYSTGRQRGKQKVPAQHRHALDQDPCVSGIAFHDDIGDTSHHVGQEAHVLHPATDYHITQSYVSDSFSRSLMSYFHTKVVSRLTWLDSLDNPWRKVVLPHVQQSSCLRLSILNLAATHLSVTFEGDAPKIVAIREASCHLRHVTLQVLNKEISRELNQSNPKTNTAMQKHGSGLCHILASALALCYGEMLVPQSTDWNIHFRACRTIIDKFNLRKWIESQDPVLRFMVKEVEDLEVWGNLASFTKGQHAVTKMCTQPRTGSRFWAFTDLIGDITLVERRQYQMEREGNKTPNVDIGSWKAKADEVYTQVSTSTDFASPYDVAMRQLFDPVIRTHYYACLIYIHQALAPRSEGSNDIGFLLTRLFNEIRSIAAGSVHAFSHDIFFPLFIAGTEIHGRMEMQNIIKATFCKLISATGVWCNNTALHFLHTFWKNTEHHGTRNWIQYARDNESEIGPLLVF
ncbi:fungal-specific transcription factor domain-containing protein [Aspergillus avenaceus]|uniref:Fungal-specific transcription factor domain-containing protein n=1 Tax=Aspergillus avenaceus TaxID=36643 RepID=A0A5N6TRG6_ASPAV|nr:fungal-specific transcription factor domain-containing protein [Aspergillus avenaceus]